MELESREKSVLEIDREKKQLFKDRLRQLSECQEIVSAETLNAIGRVTQDVRAADDNAPSSDELDENLEEEYQDLNLILDLPDDTYSLTAIRPELPPCVRYGVRSGLTHINIPKFSPLSRGHQGGATAIAAFATTTIYKSRCWNEAVIDQIIEDGDTFYCQSYKDINTDDRRLLTIQDLKRELFVQNKLNVNVSIEDAAYAGKFRSTNPTELHLVKALDLFFKRYDAGILTSSVLNIAIWKDPRYYNIFDGQPRKENCEPAEDGMDGTAKLFLVKDLIGVLFIILEKSNVMNEPFVIYSIAISGVEPFSLADAPDVAEKTLGKPRHRPSGYNVQEKYRAVLQGSYHLMHPSIPEILRGKGHLIIAMAALIYSRLINANKWTTALIDLIFNQSNMYFVDLVRVLEKDFADEEFELRLDDLMGDVILGVYSAKVKLRQNMIPGYGSKKGKSTIDSGIREFFETQVAGILEIKKFYYAIWKEDNTYYFLDPFACDDEGYRVTFTEMERTSKSYQEAACVTMNSSINQVVETIMENTGNKDRDPFLIHGLRVLYVKTGVTPGGPFEKVIYREKGTSRRPQAPPLAVPYGTVDKAIDNAPRIRPEMDKMRDIAIQSPALMDNADDYMMKDDEPLTYIVEPPEEETKTEEEVEEEMEEEETDTEVTFDPGEQTEDDEDTIEEEPAPPVQEPIVKVLKGYKKINPHRLILQGTKNCLDEQFELRSRGRQGLIAALTVLAYRKLKNPENWRNMDIDQIIDVSNKTYDEVIEWIKAGRPEIKDEKAKEIMGEGEEEEEEEDEEEAEEEEDEQKLIPAPSHLDMTMLPVRLKLGENDVFFKTKMKVFDGEAYPLANLAEALECYFKQYTQLVMENKRLMYGIWKQEGKFFMFNPYGADEEGWRLRDYPATFAVTDTLNELVDLFHGVLEFNDPVFTFHFAALDSIQPGKYATDEEIIIPDDNTIEKFKTSFLPITDDDLLAFQPPPVLDAESEDILREAVDEEEDEDMDEEDEDLPRAARLRALTLLLEKPVVDPLLEVKEQDQVDAPHRLNLMLLTSNMKIFEDDPEVINRLHDQVVLEKLKYSHPPPYVLPSGRTLATLLEAKRAKRSVHSLVSRFSIDSRLDVKRKGGFSSIFLGPRGALLLPTMMDDDTKPAKMIKLSPKRYLYSRVLPICLMPLRAIDDKYIQIDNGDKDAEDETEETWEERQKDMVREDVPEAPVGIRIRPELIPLGPVIKTPTITKKVVTCFEKTKRKCLLAKGDEGDAVMEKIHCETEDLLLELFFPGFKAKDQLPPEEKAAETREKKLNKEKPDTELTTIRVSNASKKKSPDQREPIGFKATDHRLRVIQGNLCLENREQEELCHFKSCFFAAMLCILAKITMDPNRFRGSTLDQFIFLGDKIYRRTGKLRFKPYRWFHHIEILETMFNVITQQAIYADPESSPEDDLETVMETFLAKNKTGILVFPTCSYAFWTADDRYYLFDPYACNEKGNPNKDGSACLMELCNLNSMLDKIKQNVGENVGKPYRLYSLSIAHMESRKRKKKRRKKRVHCEEKKEQETQRVEEPPDAELSTESEVSLIESSDWIKLEPKASIVHDMTIPGFSPIKYYNASVLDVIVLENEITTPRLAPFKKTPRKQEESVDEYDAAGLLVRRKVYDRNFKAHAAVTTPMDLCIMAWSLIHDPITWSVRTVRGLFEASLDYTFDSILATEDSTVVDMTDGLLPEFEVANYVFRAVFAPIHYGMMYAVEGWNLSMSLQRVFETPSYTGAIIICGDVHVGVTKKEENHFAWWIVRGTKNLRIVTSLDMKEFLRLIVKEIDQPDEVLFVMRVITISYAQKVDPDCSDTRGLHEPVVPVTSLPEIHKMEPEPYDLEAIFKPTTPDSKPIFVLGTVGLDNRDTLKEPKVKRCYFVAILSVMVMRDIIQSPVPGMIDKILEVAESLYREFSEPKFHTEHILRNVTVMNRIFDFRDCASSLVTLTVNPRTRRNDFYLQVRKHLKKYFKSHASGILHFTNCCYGFWYSRSTNAYYYLDPYQCNAKGRKVANHGKACLCIFPSACQMVKHMCFNQFEETTGFFIHRLHVDSINVAPFKSFKEDPMWLYLDYHWNFRHAPDIVKANTKRRRGPADDENQAVKQCWNNYAIEVTNLIYSVWGTIGSYDSRFGDRVGRNQAAICVAVLAMQYLSHPSRWGPAILDSAVICGDSYYTESLRSSARKCAKHFNRFNLQTCFKIFPHLWTIDFRGEVCGILYGTRNRMTLTAGLKLAFDEAPNVLVECNKITLAALAAKDGYYVADPCWVGPPLFDKDHGAIYALRCRNMNSLIYAITKMLNTNQRLDFRLTPIIFTFEQEDFNFVDSNTRVAKKKLLVEPVRMTPGKIEIPVPTIPGAVTVPDEDSYLCYRQNLTRGIRKGHELENPELPSIKPILETDNLNSMQVSTTWHLNLGQADPLKKVHPPFDPTVVEHVPELCEKRVVDSFAPRQPPRRSITDFLAACDDYPRVVDFTKHRRKTTIPLECMVARSFLTETARDEFRNWTKEMAHETYKTYKHRLPKPEDKQVKRGEAGTSKSGEIHTILEEQKHDADRAQDSEAVTEGTEDGMITATDVSDTTDGGRD